MGSLKEGWIEEDYFYLLPLAGKSLLAGKNNKALGFDHGGEDCRALVPGCGGEDFFSFGNQKAPDEMDQACFLGNILPKNAFQGGAEEAFMAGHLQYGGPDKLLK